MILDNYQIFTYTESTNFLWAWHDNTCFPKQVKASQTQKQLHLLWTTELRTNNGLWEKLQVLEALLKTYGGTAILLTVC